MANRVSDAEVRAIMTSVDDALTDLDPFIDAANIIVDKVASCATAKGGTLRSTRARWTWAWT